MENENIVFQAKDVCKMIKGKVLINGLSLELYQNEIFGLLGVNGAGKTTIIKLIVGLIKTTSGNFELLGFKPEKNFEEYIKNVGISLDLPVLYDYMTGYQNLKHFSKYYRSVDNNKIQEIIHMFKLEEIINSKVSTYSMGMKQKLNIGQAIIHSPQFLILDEPTNGLDPKAIKELRDILINYKKQNNATILISSHNLLEVENLCDRVGIIDKGKLIKTYDAKEIENLHSTKNYSLEDIFLNSIDRR